MYEDQQMEWLKNALLTSNASFKIIVTGSQALNPISIYDSFHHFPVEYHDFMNFLEQNHIPGILFLTGDRHHSEVVKLPRKNTLPAVRHHQFAAYFRRGRGAAWEWKRQSLPCAGHAGSDPKLRTDQRFRSQRGRVLKLEFMDKGKQVLGRFEVNQQELRK